MLQVMRAKAQGMGSKIVVWLIIIALAVFGFGSFSLFQPSEQVAASVNGEDISIAELQRQVEGRTAELVAQFGDAYVDQFDPSLLSRTVLVNMVQAELLRNYTSELGFKVSEGQVDQEIVARPEFMLSDGFSPELFRRRAAEAGLTPESLRSEIVDSLGMSALQQALVDSAFLTQGDSRRLLNLALQSRDIAWLEFRPIRFVDQVEIDDETLATAYELRLAEFMTEPRIDAEYLAFRLQEMAALSEFAPEEGALREAYQAELSEYEISEQRDASHILREVSELRTEAQAIEELSAIRERVLAGESFEEFAMDLSDDPGSAEVGGLLGPAARGVYVEAFEEALWNLQAGEISEPVVSEFGVHLIRLNEILRHEAPSFEDRRVALESELRRSAARDRFSEIKLRADELAFDAQNSLAPLVEAFERELVEVSGVTRTIGDDVFRESVLREALFDSDVMDSGFNSPLIEVGEEAAYVVRAARRHPATQLTFGEVREELRREIAYERAVELSARAARQALSRMLEGVGASEVAFADQEWQRRDAIQRNGGDLPALIRQAAFELPRPPKAERSMEVVALDDGGSALIVVSGVRDGNTAEVPQSELQSLEDQVKSLASQRDLISLFANLYEDADIESDLFDI